MDFIDNRGLFGDYSSSNILIACSLIHVRLSGNGIDCFISLFNKFICYFNAPFAFDE